MPGSEYIDGSVLVRPIRIRRIPGPLGKCRSTFHDFFRNISLDPDTAPVVVNKNRTAGSYSSFLGIGRVQDESLRIQFLQIFIIIVNAVASSFCMPADQLKRILFTERILISFRRFNVSGDRRKVFFKLQRLNEGRIQLDPAALCRERMTIRLPDIFFKMKNRAYLSVCPVNSSKWLRHF